MMLRTAVMDNRITVWIKQEVTDEQDSMVLGDQPITEKPLVHVKEEPELYANTSEHNLVEDSLAIYGSTDCIKEDPELNLAVDENIGVASEDVTTDECDPLNIECEQELAPERCSPGSTQLIKTTCEVGSILLEKKYLQGVPGNKLQVAAEKSTPYIRSGTQTQQDITLSTSSNYSLEDNEFQNFSCSSCKQCFTSKYSLTMHVFTHIDGVMPPVHICKWCGEVFFTRASLENHSKQIPAEPGQSKKQIIMHNSRGSLKCDFCGKLFTHSNDLRNHALIHLDERPHTCDVCGKCFTHLGKYKKHVLMHTYGRPYLCVVCRKTFSQFGHLKTHSLLHTGERPHKCDICGKCFTTSGNLKTHALIHSGERRHTCDICGKAFKHTTTLKNHIRIHTGDKPHTCEVCGKTFFNTFALKTHFLVHTGERPYKCDICRMSFRWSSVLKKHKMGHTGERPYKCDTCEKSFTRAGHLKRHELKHTGEGPH